MYQKLLGKPLPENLLLVPVQYLLCNQCYYCTFLLQIEEQIAQGTFKSVEKSTIVDIIGTVPSPEIHALKGTSIAFYRPRESHDLFLNDIKDIIKLDELLLQNYSIKGFISRITGHSLFLPETYNGFIGKYTDLIGQKIIRQEFHFDDVLFSLKKSLESVILAEDVAPLTKEILSHNDLINSPYMFAPFLPYDLISGFSSLEKEKIFQSVYEMVAMVSFYAAEGIYFRDLCPDNFRIDKNQKVKLIDPSYISQSIRKSKRYECFLQQTRPEYLPNELTLLSRKSHHSVISYFGQFTEGVCIGMLERVIKRIFLSEYMKERYDELFRLDNRIEKCHELRWQEDIDLFKDVAEEYNEEHFKEYRKNIHDRMRREKWDEDISFKISSVLETLRKFSKPIMRGIQYKSYLKEGDVEMEISSLPSYIAKKMQIIPEIKDATKKFLQPTKVRIPSPLIGSGTRRFAAPRKMLIKQSDVENYNIRQKTERLATPKKDNNNLN